MAELPQSPGSGPPRMDAGDESGTHGPRDRGPQDRPRLVAVPRREPPEAAERGAAERGGAERGGAEPPPAATVDPHRVRLELERALRPPARAVPATQEMSTGPATTGTPAAPLTPAAPATTAVPSSPRAWTAVVEPATPELVRALRAELAMRATAEAGLRARVVDAETRLSAHTIASQRTAGTLREIRAELERLAELVADERTRRATAERRVAALERELHELRAQHEPRGDAGDAERDPGALRDSLAQLGAPAADAENAGISTRDAAPVQSERLADALTRLRANAQPLEQPAAPAAAATLAGPFRTLCRRDPALAGRLAISLLGMERIVHPHPIAFDLHLGPGAGCIQVTSSGTRTDVVAETTARPPEQVAFRVVGGPDRIARLLVAGRLRRLLGFGVARVHGDRDGLAALEALLALPLDLPALVEGGMLSDSMSLLSLVAAVVRPEWTRGAYFVLSHRDGDARPSYLRFVGGRRAEVTATEPVGPIATAISCSGHDLASLLTSAIGPDGAGVEVLGDAAPLMQLQGWIKRAQSG